MPPTELTASALLFDMDGTVIDSTVAVEAIWGIFADRFDLDVSQILQTSHGVRMIETVRKHAPDDADAEQITRELTLIELADREGIVAIPGAPEFFEKLGGVKTALVTSATRELAEVRMSLVGIPMPGVVVSAEDVNHGKPQPDCYLLAADRLGVPPDDCIVFEDAEAGIRAGLAAGMRVVVVGDWQSETTSGLPRVSDFAGIRLILPTVPRRSDSDESEVVVLQFK